MQIVKAGRLLSIEVAKDLRWRETSSAGFVHTHWFSLLTTVDPELPGVTFLLLIMGPVKFCLGWTKKEATWLVPCYACFGLNTLTLMYHAQKGYWGHAVVDLVLIFWIAYSIAWTSARLAQHKGPKPAEER